jgi:hypothetical protein
VKKCLLLLLLSACGSPFVDGEFSDAQAPSSDARSNDVQRDTRPHDPGYEAGIEASREASRQEASSKEDAGEAGDAEADTGTDTGPIDAWTVDSPSYSGDANDASDAVDATSPCTTTLTTSSYNIFQGGSMFADYPSPAQCQCVTSYTCSCLSKYASACMSGERPTGTCSIVGSGTIVVDCGL